MEDYGRYVEPTKDVEDYADVVVVGSGAGGGAIAAELAEAGFSVIVVEEGGYFTSKDFKYEPIEMIQKLYRDAGTGVIQGKPPIVFTEGRCVGGSTVINGGLSWRTPEKVLKKWHWEFQLDEITPKSLEPYFNRVEKRVSVSIQPDDTIGMDARLIKIGADRLGYKTEPARRNISGCRGLNNCIFGCPVDAKKSTLVAYIPSVEKHGGKIYPWVRAEKLIVKNGKAAGIEGRFVARNFKKTKFRLKVRAKIVIIAGGAIQTPHFLLKNKFKSSSKQVGKNLFAHPNAKAIAIFDDPVFGWKGTIQGWQLTEFREEGILASTTFVPPGMIAMSIPPIGEDNLKVMEYYNNMVSAGVLVEDTGSGVVKPGPFDMAMAIYNINDYDFYKIKRGIAILSEIYFAAGAKRVLLPFDHLKEINSPDEIRKIFEIPIGKLETELLTVHVMGTARMSGKKELGVVNQWLESWDIENLFITDASVFPTPIGVNPQITIMTLATWAASHIVENRKHYLNS